MPLISSEQLEPRVVNIFKHAGCSDEEARRIAHYLVAANLAGHDSQGVIRVARYLQAMRQEWVLPDQRVVVFTRSDP